MYIHDPPPLNIGQLSSKLANASFSMRGRKPPRNKEKFELLFFIVTLMSLTVPLNFLNLMVLDPFMLVLIG